MLAGVANILVCFEQRSNVYCLTAPNLSVNSPVERKFQRSPVERARDKKNQVSNSNVLYRNRLTQLCCWTWLYLEG